MAAKSPFSSKLLSIVLFLLGLQGLACLIALMLIPADPTNASLFGYSATRLVIAGALLVGTVGFGTSAVLIFKNNLMLQRARSLLMSSLAFPFLLVGSLIGIALSMNWRFATAELLASYQRAFPLILFVTLSFIQLLVLRLYANGTQKQRKLTFAAVVGVLTFCYLVATVHYSEVNREYWLSDQEPMLNLTRSIKETNYADTGSRDFMPGFPTLAGPFMNTTLGNEELFAQGKLVNTLLSLAFLVIIFLAVRQRFKLPYALLFVLVIAFTLFIYKAPYFQPELTYYFFSFFAFVLMIRQFTKPNIFAALGAGLLLALAQYTKASVLPMAILFSLAMCVQAIITWVAHKYEKGRAAQFLAVAAVTLVAFLLPLAPYLQESKEKYGSYFYNVNSTYYIWFDSFGEAKASDQILHYALGRPEIPESELPSLNSYLRDHGASEILARFGKGFANQVSNWINTFALISFPLFFLAGSIVLAVQRRSKAWELIRAHPVPTLFLITYFVSHTILFAWYGPIADYADQRFTYGLMLPLLFTEFLTLKTLATSPKDGATRSDWLPAFYGAATTLLAIDLLLRLPAQFIDFHWFGK
jgi:hypothetical protein